MKLSRIVNAYLACDDLGKDKMPYRSALAIWEVFDRTESGFRFFREEQRKLLESVKSGELTEEDYGKELAALMDTEMEWVHREREMKAPAEIKPMTIEALKGFIHFREG